MASERTEPRWDALRERVAALSATQRRLLARWLVSETGGAASTRVTLVGYVETAEPGALDAAELRRGLSRHLPEYMVPTAIVVMDTLPRTASGKVDRRSLPRPEPMAASRGPAVDEAPAGGRESEAHATLARIWSEVLGTDEISIHDDFFELGGDSILSIRLIARANDAGVKVAPERFFETPTIAGMMAAASGGSAASPTAPSAATSHTPLAPDPEDGDEGAAPLTPIQHWFFDHVRTDPEQWNQAVVLEGPRGLDANGLQRAVARLLDHHAALRSRFSRPWSTWTIADRSPASDPPVEHLVLAETGTDEQVAALDALEARLHRSLDLERGPLVRAALVDRGPVPPWIVLVVHHLVIDGVSWTILLEDLETLCAASTDRGPSADSARTGSDAPDGAPDGASSGTSNVLPRRTTSYRRWARALADAAADSSRDWGASYWTAPHGLEDLKVPVDATESPARNTRGDARVVVAALDATETEALLREVPQAYRTQVNDVLLSGLLLAFETWTKSPRLWVNVEGHGRQAWDASIDVSRTVGWFTSVYPLLLRIEPVEDPASRDLGDVLKAVKEQLRQVPQHGLGHGILRYLAPEGPVREALRRQPEPEVLFNYYGQRDSGRFSTPRTPSTGAGGPSPQLLVLVRDAGSTSRSPRAQRPCLLELDAVVDGGIFRAQWTYGAHVHHHETIRRLADGYIAILRRLIAHCTSGQSGVTPSDFPLAGLDQGDLDRIAGALGDDADEAS